MSVITTSEALWSSSMMPEGIIERWLREDGDTVDPGEAVVEVRIEDALHEIAAPDAGRLRIWLRSNSVVEPGATLGEVI